MTTTKKDTIKYKIISIISKLDNGSHSANQLQGIDEALTALFEESLSQQNSYLRSEVEKMKREIIKAKGMFTPMQDAKDESYNQALEDVLKMMSEKHE